MTDKVKVVVILECSGGNESVGNEWHETAVFDHDATLLDVLAWRERHNNHALGRLIITLPGGEKHKLQELYRSTVPF